MVERVEFDGRRAAGVRFRQNGEVKVARCRGEVILAAGSIGSIQTLLLSGVGPAAQLRNSASRWCSTSPASARICRTICNCG